MTHKREKKIVGQWRLVWVLGLALLWCLATPAQALKAEHREVLPNGVTLMVSPTLASPTVSINIFVKVGSFEEDSSISGISHFYEHLFFRGTASMHGQQFKRSLEAIGGNANANTNRDYTHFFVNLPKEKVKEGIALMADAYLNSQLDPEAIDQERKAVLEEYNMGQDNPQRLIYDRVYSLAYGDNHPYSLPIIGTEQNIRNFQREDFMRFRETFHTPERTTVVVVGDVNLQEILPLLRQSFGSFHRSSGKSMRRAAAIPAPTQPVEDVMNFHLKNCLLMLGFPGPCVHDKPDIYRMDVAMFLLGIGRSSLLEREVVDKELALNAGADFLTQRFPGMLIVYAVSKPEKEKEAREALLGAIDKLKQGNFSERDVRRAKAFLCSNFDLGNESNAGKASSLGFYASVGEEAFPADYTKRIREVSAADVTAVAKKYFGNGYYSVTMRDTQPEVKRHSKLDDYDNMGRRKRSAGGWW